LRLYRDTVFELAPDSTLRSAVPLPSAFVQAYAPKAVCPQPGGYFFLATKSPTFPNPVLCVMTDAAFSVLSQLPVEGRFPGRVAPTSNGGCLVANPMVEPTLPQGVQGPSVASKVAPDNSLQY